jgi:hypothetical protein
MNYDAIPDYLRSLKQFCVRIQKQPYIKGKKGYVSKGWSKKPENWLTFAEAISAIERKEHASFDGKFLELEAIGFLTGRLNAKPPYLIGGDLDCCRDPETGELSKWADEFLLKILPFYVEVSPSECGIRFFILGNMDRDSVTGNGDQNDIEQEFRDRMFKIKPKAFSKFCAGIPAVNGLELYEMGRHLSLTGNKIEDYCFPMEDRTLPILKAIAPFLIKPDVSIEKSNPNKESTLPHIHILDVVDTTGFIQSGNQLLGPHPLGSTTGKNLVINPEKNTYCYMHNGCNAGGSAWEWLACECGVMDWENTKSGALKDRTLLEKTLQHAVSRGLITEKEAQIDIQSAVRKVDLNSPFWSIGMLESNGTIVRIEPSKTNVEKKVITWVSDCVIWVDTETKFDDDTEFVFKGKGAKDQREITFTLSASAMAEPKRLRAKLFNAFGIANRLGEITFEDIQSITNHTRCLKRVEIPKWDGDEPLIPGYNVNNNIIFNISSQIPANVYDGDIEIAKKALRILFKVHKYSSVLVATILGAPAIARWYPDYRFALGLWGTSGNLKTTTATTAMGMWGLGYLNGPTLMAGRGASTVNGAMDVFAAAGFLPQIYDDVKTVDKKDKELYVALIHKVMEGYEKIRSQKDGGLRDTVKFACIPIVTGELRPMEASTSARVLSLDWNMPPEGKKTASAALSELREIQSSLPVVGYTWIKFLHETDEQLSKDFYKYRDILTRKFADLGYVNSGRLASTYAMLKSIWSLLEISPLGDVFTENRNEFIKTLDILISDQGEQVCRETEVSRFLRTLRSMVTLEPDIVQRQAVKVIYTAMKPPIGRWMKDGLFVVPEVTLHAVTRAGAFEQMPDVNSMTKSLVEIDALIQDTDGKHHMFKGTINGSQIRGWYIKSSAIPGLNEMLGGLPPAIPKA